MISVDQYLGEKYKFDVMENFEECANIYKQESLLIQKLIETKTRLVTLKYDLMTQVQNMSKQSMTDLRNIFIDEHHKRKSDSSFINILSKIFPKRDDVTGALRAMFILHYTYYLNVTSAITSGKLSYLNHHKEMIHFQVSHVELTKVNTYPLH